jgi:ribonuclease BN (tRNA processing enzyme)
MTSVQAGEAASQAGVRSLLLTHVWPTFDPQDILEEVKGVYSGEVALAREGMTLRLGGEEDAEV